MPKKTTIHKILCKECKNETNHTLEWEKSIGWEDKRSEIRGSVSYQVLSCNGCDAITFRTVSSNSEDVVMGEKNEKTGIYDAEYIETIKYYPERGHNIIEPIFDIWRTPNTVRRIYNETIQAFNNKQHVLCAIGIRGIIEAICIEEGINIKNLKSKIDELHNEGIITSTLCEGLHESRLMGNASAHKINLFGDNELRTVIGLINTLIESHYSMPDKVKKLKQRNSIKHPSMMEEYVNKPSNTTRS